MDNIYQISITLIVLIIILFTLFIIQNYNSKKCNFKNINKIVKYERPKKKVVSINYENIFSNKFEKNKICNKNTSECEYPRFKHPCCVTNGIIMMRDVFEIFQKYSIPIWIRGNTLLGYKRYSGFISWDSKIETSTCVDNLKNICKELEIKGYDINYNIEKYIVYYSKTNRLELEILIENKTNIKKCKLYDIDINIPSNISIDDFHTDENGKIIQDIDVLFIGSLHKRRKKIYDDLINSPKMKGKKIVFKTNVIDKEKELLLSLIHI